MTFSKWRATPCRYRTTSMRVFHRYVDLPQFAVNSQPQLPSHLCSITKANRAHNPLNMLLPIRKCLNGSVQSGSIVHLLSLAIPQAARSAQVVAGHIHCDENTEEAKQLREKQQTMFNPISMWMNRLFNSPFLCFPSQTQVGRRQPRYQRSEQIT